LSDYLSSIIRRLPSTWRIFAILALPISAWAGAAQAQQEENLLFNGGFEGTYVAPIPGRDNINVAPGWLPYWVQGSPEENAQGYKVQPEYKAAFTTDFPYTRVRSGAQAQQYFHSFATFIGGVMQQVTVPRNARLRFSAWGQAWSCLYFEDCPDATSVNPAPMHMRIGIDPTGGTDWTSPNVVWSPYADPYDAYQLFTVEAVAVGTQVTVFLYAAPEYRNDDNDVYWDDASLVVLGPPSPTPQPTRTPGPSPTPRPTRTPGPSPTLPPGAVTYAVQRGDTLRSIATRFNTTVAELQRLNHLDGSTAISVGQVLIVAFATPTPTATVRPATATPRPSATPSPTPTQPPTGSPQPERSQLCVLAFYDSNRDGLRQPDEAGQTGLAISLMDSNSTLVATTNEAWHCFDLAPGRYTLSARLPQTLSATTPLTHTATLLPDQTVEVDIGSAVVGAKDSSPVLVVRPLSPTNTALVWAAGLGIIVLAALAITLVRRGRQGT
jgi:hypothetical protein